MKREFLVERQGRTFALYAGLLDAAHQRGLRSIRTELVQVPSDANGQLAIVKAVVETAQGVFEGLGDASPASVKSSMASRLVALAETRAKGRALRDSVNASVTALEELEDAGEAVSASGGRSAQTAKRKPEPTPEEIRAGYNRLAHLARALGGLAAPLGDRVPIPEVRDRGARLKSWLGQWWGDDSAPLGKIGPYWERLWQEAEELGIVGDDAPRLDPQAAWEKQCQQLGELRKRVEQAKAAQRKAAGGR